MHLEDSAAVDYKDAGEQPPPVATTPPVIDAGPCMHVDSMGKPDCADTLAVNADFDRTIQSWTSEQGAVLRWVDFDSDGAKGSGSLGVKNGLVGNQDGTLGVYATQCLAAQPDTTYEYASSLFIRKGQPYGQGVIVVYFYTQPGCQGSISSATTVAGTDATEAWMIAAGTLSTPDDIGSMSVHLVVQKAYRVDPIEVLFDAVRVTQIQTAVTP